MSCTISVVIPVYNSARFIGRCLDSLTGQSMASWEAVCVDDGSTDGSAALLDAYASRDARIRVVHRANGGVGAARNAALELVEGEYVMFVDSDDFLHPQAMEICLYFAERDGSSLVAFTYDRMLRTRLTARHFLHLPERKHFCFRKYRVSDVESLVTDNIFDYATELSHSGGKWIVKHCQPWRCLYRAELVRGIKFPEGIMYEDFPWWGEVLLRSGRVTIINLPLYCYYPDFGGFIHSASRQKRIDSLRRAIPLAESVFEGIDDTRREKWERNFLEPFRRKLEKKTGGCNG